jgi:hypothetical protein
MFVLMFFFRGILEDLWIVWVLGIVWVLWIVWVVWVPIVRLLDSTELPFEKFQTQV